VNYAHKIEKAESLIDWSESAEVIARRLRAFNPFPGGATALGGEAIKVWEAAAEAGSGSPGTVLSADAHGVRVACGSGVLKMTLLQRAGGKRLAAADFLRGFELPAGAVLGGEPAGA
jgi:methionyl-tRNA formyltransferase